MPDHLTAAEIERPETAVKPFRFNTSLILQEATGLRASTLPELLGLLREAPDACIYHHTHFFLLQHQYLTPEPSNDFAYWVGEVLGERPLGELLAGIDTISFSNTREFKEALVTTIEDYLRQNPASQKRFVSGGSEFFLLKSIHIVLPTAYTAVNLKEFARALEHISIRSLYFHIFDARLRLEQPNNDFSIWLGGQLGLAELAKSLTSLDPYAYTLEALRSIVLSLVQQEMRK